MTSANPVSEKLGEARYFLERMEQSQEAQHEFKYHLSAFLSAARDVASAFQDHYPPRDRSTNEWLEGLRLATQSLSTTLSEYFKAARQCTPCEGAASVGHGKRSHPREVNATAHPTRISKTGPGLREWLAKLDLPLRIGTITTTQTVWSTGTSSDPSIGESGWFDHFEVGHVHTWEFGEWAQDPWCSNQVLGICAYWFDALEQVVIEAVERSGDQAGS